MFKLFSLPCRQRRGRAYIHRAGSSHGNIKSSNIVITPSRDGAHVAGIGIPRLVGTASLPRRGAGYRAPEVTDARVVAPSADAYSFGVVVLELLSGRAPAPADGGVDLPRWVRSVVQEEWTSEVFDSTIAGDARVEDEMMRLLRLGVECTEQRPDRRPAMADVEARIEQIAEDACRKAEFSSTDGSRSVSA
jgi:serine/threonine protein kinase